MNTLKGANLALAFVLELLMLVAFACWAFVAGHGSWAGTLAAVVIVVVAIALWAIWGAPKSARRLKMPGLLVFKLVIFGLAVVGLWAAGQPVWAVLLALLTALNLVLAGLWDQH
jgi:hypothetical protein